eukprot:XP_019921852.1 PREDICTED: cell death abnormality protein 1-like [Crassostrea gigas]
MSTIGVAIQHGDDVEVEIRLIEPVAQKDSDYSNVTPLSDMIDAFTSLTVPKDKPVIILNNENSVEVLVTTIVLNALHQLWVDGETDISLISRYLLTLQPSEPMSVCDKDLGCDVGFYGENCRKCPDNCLNDTCEVQTGDCFCCKDGFSGRMCEEGCDVGFYGENCTKCPDNCLNDTCEVQTGDCFCCKDGFSGKMCEEECPHGQYGKACSSQCGNCLNQMPCNYLNGTCQGGCSSGWTGDKCAQKCPSTLYGPNCNTICSEHCQNRSCNQLNGYCLACDGARFGNLCESEQPLQENLALNKTVTVSQRYNNKDFDPSLAVDGDHSTDLLKCSQTANGQKEAWLTVDLEEEKNIASISFTHGGCKFYIESRFSPLIIILL